MNILSNILKIDYKLYIVNDLSIIKKIYDPYLFQYNLGFGLGKYSKNYNIINLINYKNIYYFIFYNRNDDVSYIISYDNKNYIQLMKNNNKFIEQYNYVNSKGIKYKKKYYYKPEIEIICENNKKYIKKTYVYCKSKQLFKNYCYQYSISEYYYYCNNNYYFKKYNSKHRLSIIKYVSDRVKQINYFYNNYKIYIDCHRDKYNYIRKLKYYVNYNIIKIFL